MESMRGRTSCLRGARTTGAVEKPETYEEGGALGARRLRRKQLRSLWPLQVHVRGVRGCWRIVATKVGLESTGVGEGLGTSLSFLAILVPKSSKNRLV